MTFHGAKKLVGTCEAHFAPTGSASERRILMGWLTDRAADSDNPSCVWHEHESERPCNDACHMVAPLKVVCSTPPCRHDRACTRHQIGDRKVPE